MNKELSNAEFLLNLGNLEGHSRLPVSCAWRKTAFIGINYKNA